MFGIPQLRTFKGQQKDKLTYSKNIVENGNIQSWKCINELIKKRRYQNYQLQCVNSQLHSKEVENLELERSLINYQSTFKKLTRIYSKSKNYGSKLKQLIEHAPSPITTALNPSIENNKIYSRSPISNNTGFFKRVPILISELHSILNKRKNRTVEIMRYINIMPKLLIR